MISEQEKMLLRSRWAPDESPPPEGSCPCAGAKPFQDTGFRKCKVDGYNCSHHEWSLQSNYDVCPNYVKHRQEHQP